MGTEVVAPLGYPGCRKEASGILNQGQKKRNLDGRLFWEKLNRPQKMISGATKNPPVLDAK